MPTTIDQQPSSDVQNNFPAPWKLSGLGFIMVFWGPRRIDAYSGVEVSGIGSVMIVKYENSPVGPYNELLYIPGRQTLNGKRGFFISKIYVDSEASVQGGRANWGIPKEFANIAINVANDGTSQVEVSAGQETFFASAFKPMLLSFPITTAILPVALVQHLNGINFETKFRGNGSAKLCKATVEVRNENSFPDISRFKQLGSLAVNPFRLEFPIPEIF